MQVSQNASLYLFALHKISCRAARFILGSAHVEARCIFSDSRSEPAEGLPISRPAVSQHLKALLDSDLVKVTAKGTKRIYSINAQGFNKLNLWLDQFWA